MPSAARDLLARLADANGLPHPDHSPAIDSAAELDLSRASPLLDLASPSCAARLEERIARPPTTDATRAALAGLLRDFCGFGDAARVQFGHSAAELVTAHLAALAQRRGPRATTLVQVGGPRDATAGFAAPSGGEALRFAPEQLDVAMQLLRDAPQTLVALLLEPRTLDDELPLADCCRTAAAQGVPLLIDERWTAFRTAPATVVRDCELPADAVLFGDRLAAGLPFAAICHRDANGPLPDVDADPLALRVAEALASLLAERPPAESTTAADAILRERFRRRCSEEDIHASLVGPAGLPTLRFAGQENAEAPLIAHHFGLELGQLGVTTDGPDLLPPARGAQVESLARALENAVSRVRTLLIEHNSYLCGGLPWPFESREPRRLVERGLANYRYPKLGAVDVESLPDEGGVRIAFAAAELGPVTSSGFYLPTRLRGDLDVSIRFHIERWKPGPDSACLGLFFQNEASTARYYAQLMTTGDRPQERSVAGGLQGRILGRTTVPGETGQLRLTRRAAQLSAWYRGGDDDEWQELGTLHQATEDDVICGAKIWSKVRCEGLVALLTDLRVSAEIPTEQIPELPSRPDPRQP